MTSLWAGEFGNDYTRRNVGNIDARAQLWKMLLPRDCRSVLEVGANIGLNLEAIGRNSDCDLYATEPNDLAREELINGGFVPSSAVTSDYADRITFPDNIADLVFTCGVLIHVPPDILQASMAEIHRCAKRWIITAEYFAPSEEMVPYRGHSNALWRRDYGSLWLDTFSDLHCDACVFCWKRMTGLDNLTIWVFEKGRRAN